MSNLSNNSPLVSIVTPMHNAGPFLYKTIQSVLNQTYANYEWIIVDDKSTDDSLKVVKAIKNSRIHVIEREIDKGTAHA